jgi:hypothetical protein
MFWQHVGPLQAGVVVATDGVQEREPAVLSVSQQHSSCTNASTDKLVTEPETTVTEPTEPALMVT